MFEKTFGHFARVLVDMDVTQELRYKVLVERKGFSFFVELDFENIPDYCTHCKKIGDYINICKNLQRNEVVNDEAGKMRDSRKNRKEYVQIADGRKKQGSMETNPIVVDEAVADKPEGNLEKSPTLGERTEVVNNVDVVKQQNKFSALLNVDNDSIRKEMRVEDLQLEVELNKELVVQGIADEDQSDSNSHESEFVDSTQQFVTSSSKQIIEEGNAIDLAILDRENKQFLDQSWANIAEDEDAERRMLQDMDAQLLMDLRWYIDQRTS